jgi:hypothetical protein
MHNFQPLLSLIPAWKHKQAEIYTWVQTTGTPTKHHTSTSINPMYVFLKVMLKVKNQ